MKTVTATYAFIPQRVQVLPEPPQNHGVPTVRRQGC
jgi:hypothetical protein